MENENFNGLDGVPDQPPLTSAPGIVSNLTLLDYIVAPALAALAAVWTFFHIFSSNGWDDMYYMSISQYTRPWAWILNRYGHIYLQKLFFWLANDAFRGARAYWCFLFFSTAILIYFCAKLIAGRKAYAVATIAVLIFCSQPFFAEWSGCTDADLTVMFLTTLAIFIYLAFLNPQNRYRHIIIVLLGLLFFWATKSKETGVCIAILFLGLGRDNTNHFRISRLIKDTAWLFIGILAGSVFLIGLDAVFLADPFFSIRPANILGVLDKNLNAPPEMLNPFYAQRPIRSWYMYFTGNPLFAVFLSYLLVGWKHPSRTLSTHQRIAWLFPLFFLLFLTFIRSNFVVLPRYLLPAIPALCIWAAQFFTFDLNPVAPKIHSRTAKLILACVAGVAAFLAALFITHSIPLFIEFYKRPKNLEFFYAVAIMPPATIIIFITAALSKKRALLCQFLLWFSLALIIYPPLHDSVTSLHYQVVATKNRNRYKPFLVFRDKFDFEKDARIFISKNIYELAHALGRDYIADCCMFNIVYNQKYEYNQFTQADPLELLKADFTYAFITWNDLAQIRKEYGTDRLQLKYTLETDKSVPIVLLKKRLPY